MSGNNSKYFIYNDFIFETYLNSPDLNFKQIARLVVDEFNLNPIDTDAIRRHCSRHIKYRLSDKELLESNVRYKKEKQKFQDKNRIDNKTFREYARVENAVEDLGQAIKEQNRKFGAHLKEFNISPITKQNKNFEVYGVMHITDTHTNELIDLPNNKYNYRIFSQRLKKYINECLEYFRFRNVGKIVILFGGDLLNSDRRLDEILNQSTNRAKAVVLTCHIFKQAILEIRNSGFEIDIISVLGNESRVKHEMTFSNEAFSDNYDFTIMAQLREMFEFSEIEGIRFTSIDKLENIVSFPQQNWLIAHNVNKIVDDQTKTQSAIGRYALKGQHIDFIVGGHIHSTRITDYSARSSSMSGSNTYNEHALNLIGRASANCFVVDGRNRYTQVIDLQDAENEGYEIISKLEAYNVKSELKLNETTTVFKVVI
ncbi:hypothetical protein ACMGDK_11420 [Chryseobacterium sp. DT-3]|uniref:hypothetical protein n=1 Tax=Chryseobacterium sp. DT-3 TaxID=3396164 RepID=UPI003F1B7B2C